MNAHDDQTMAVVYRQRRARRRMLLLALVIVPGWLLVILVSVAGLLGAVAERPAALGWAVAGWGFALWIGARLWGGWAMVRATPLGNALSPETVTRVTRAYHQVGTVLLAVAAGCALAEVIALAVITTRHAASSDITIVATSLLAAGLMAQLGKGQRHSASKIATQDWGRR